MASDRVEQLETFKGYVEQARGLLLKAWRAADGLSEEARAVEDVRFLLTKADGILLLAKDAGRVAAGEEPEEGASDDAER